MILYKFIADNQISLKIAHINRHIKAFICEYKGRTLVLALGSAPLFSRRRATFGWPLCDAR